MRLIPAHAGKTWFSAHPGTGFQAHPRSRGENASDSSRTEARSGSSPLTRGKLYHPQVDCCRSGLIPAHAGKTTGNLGADPEVRAHPRSRGENRAGSRNPVTETGSSPLTRGKPGMVTVRRARLGLIPAHAGKTPPMGCTSLFDSAHPRSRGENGSCFFPALIRAGSSPLTRGKLGLEPGGGGFAGLIPAHAGKTTLPAAYNLPSRAHPRSRGENLVAGRWLLLRWGSSPLTRGKRRRQGAGPGRGRLIPAHAGKTRPSPATVKGRSAHPRSRGENFTK